MNIRHMVRTKSTGKITDILTFLGGSGSSTLLNNFDDRLFRFSSAGLEPAVASKGGDFMFALYGSNDGLRSVVPDDVAAVANGVVLLPLLNELRNSINLLVVGSALGLTRFLTESLATVTSESDLWSDVAVGLVPAGVTVAAVEVGDVNDTLGFDSALT